MPQSPLPPPHSGAWHQFFWPGILFPRSLACEFTSLLSCPLLVRPQMKLRPRLSPSSTPIWLVPFTISFTYSLLSIVLMVFCLSLPRREARTRIGTLSVTDASHLLEECLGTSLGQPMVCEQVIEEPAEVSFPPKSSHNLCEILCILRRLFSPLSKPDG